MAHIGQEMGFGQVGFFRILLGLSQMELRFLSPGYILIDHHHRRRTIPGDHPDLNFHPNVASFLGRQFQLVAARRLFALHPFHIAPPHHFPIFGFHNGDQGSHGVELFHGVEPKHGEESIVGVNYIEIPMDEYPQQGSFHKIAEALFALFPSVHQQDHIIQPPAQHAPDDEHQQCRQHHEQQAEHIDQELCALGGKREMFPLPKQGVVGQGMGFLTEQNRFFYAGGKFRAPLCWIAQHRRKRSLDAQHHFPEGFGPLEQLRIFGEGRVDFPLAKIVDAAEHQIQLKTQVFLVGGAAIGEKSFGGLVQFQQLPLQLRKFPDAQALRVDNHGLIDKGQLAVDEHTRGDHRDHRGGRHAPAQGQQAGAEWLFGQPAPKAPAGGLA